MKNTWSAIPYAEWRDTCEALHLFTQIVGKYRLAHTPWVNHSWHATLYVNARGFTTGLVPNGAGGFQGVSLDYCFTASHHFTPDHQALGRRLEARQTRRKIVVLRKREPASYL